MPESAPAELHGVWQQSDGGRLLAVSASTADFYHVTRFVTYQDEPSSGKPLASSYVRYRLEDNGSTLVLFGYDLGDRFDQFFAHDEFRRISALPDDAVQRPGADPRFRQPEFIFELVWHHFDEQFAFFEQRRFDWAERFRRFRPIVTAQTSDAELYEVLTSMLTGLGDSHTRVYWEKKAEPFRSGNAKIVDYLDAAFARQSKFTDAGSFRRDWADKQQSFVQTLADAPLARAAGEKLRYGKLKGNVGYLEVGALSGFGPSGSTREQQLEILEREMDRIIEEFRDCAAVIIDLSFNQGGADLFGAVIASRFADRRRLALRTYAHGQTIAEARSLFIDPAGARQYTRPVYVLTTNATVSAGETLVLMMRAFPHVTHIGEVTRGCISSLLNKGMPNAFHITLSNEYWLSAKGRLYEGKGIPPRIKLRVFDPEDLMNSYPRAIRRTLELAVARSR